MRLFLYVLLSMWLSLGTAHAASSPVYQSERLSARLITAERGVTPDAQSISAALEITLADGWKTYWKSPGQVGYPPSIDWEGSQNLFSGTILFPTPERFRAFDFENYGYEHSVTFPVHILLEERGAQTDLSAQVSLLVCSDVCVPEDFSLTVSLFNDSGVDPDHAVLVADALKTLPDETGNSTLELVSTHIDATRSVLSAEIISDVPLQAPQIFPDLGLEAAFGEPSWSVAPDGLSALVELPILASPETLPQPELVFADANAAALFRPGWSETPPATAQAAQNLWVIIALAALGGLILNVMPCVLPVLSIKLTSALKAADQSLTRIRAGFLMSALGVLSFMWVLALTLIAIRMAGGQIGWGIQFQSPIFIGVMLSIITVFAANMLGLFEITLPQNFNTKLADVDGQPGLAGDFITGALTAILATPCSAPFLGTAVAVALSGSAGVTLAIFTALGVGLAAPYLLIALRPGLISALPKPGRWMLVVKWIMGLLLVLTALWLATVLASLAGWSVVAGVVGLLAIGLIAVIYQPLVAAVLIAGAMLIPAIISPATTNQAEASDLWAPFELQLIPDYISSDMVVFVDVTADWCLTCKANKALVLDQDAVEDALKSDNLVAMQADWTRPDDTILAYLQSYDRFGIPFNIVYGPGAPDGVALPEILTRSAVLEAIAQAQGDE